MSHDPDTLIDINGTMERAEDASIPILDRSFLYGDGVFEGIAIMDAQIVMLDSHVDRLYRSANQVAIDLPLAKRTVKERIIRVVRENEIENGYVRPLLSRGAGSFGISPSDDLGEPNLYVIPQPSANARRVEYRDAEPTTGRISSVRQVPAQCLDPRVKSNNFLNNILAGIDVGVDQEDAAAIMLDVDGNVAEAINANLFVVTDGVLRTPPETIVLSGCTKNAVVELASDEDIAPVECEHLTSYDLYNAAECFLTNSLIGVKPVTEIDGRTIGDGTVGETTQALGAALARYAEETGTPVE